MGRGRAKAKQTKVARELKYSSPNMDLTSLQRELANEPERPSDRPDPAEAWADEDEWRRA
ncbi:MULTISPECIES: DUF3073 domain-containing protein [Williamsia]|uniref:DUF3073 domain-containing protein n=2 Tax=Williamsia TaxID=85043 RepID=A0ABT1HBQ4_9NOCA|nr:MULTISPECIES: DUF3073 domain-containing protein [Williamsia]MBJ7289255.1 DUF3073 domain-containing protein [Williamsia sp.]MCP2175113.1 Protein of unknown function (DUF3073) [Williamsia maris]GGF38006.1 hypothetical protein GCM10007298_37190 [Williamsia phyllosphaerae]